MRFQIVDMLGYYKKEIFKKGWGLRSSSCLVSSCAGSSCAKSSRDRLGGGVLRPSTLDCDVWVDGL